MIAGGLRARLTCVDSRVLDPAFAGREFDRRPAAPTFPPTADPCGENGEFHSFVYDGPMFRSPIAIETGEAAQRRRLRLHGPPVPRIVSLIASATEIVDALGMTAHLVGRSHECDYPEAVKALPVCTRPRIPVDADSARDRPPGEGIGAHFDLHLRRLRRRDRAPASRPTS